MIVKRQNWGPSNDGELRMVYLGITIQDPPPESGRLTCLKTCHFAACFTILWTSISVFYVKTAHDVVTVLLIFAKYSSLYLHIFTCTYRGTHTQAHTYYQHTRGMATTNHRNLVKRGGKKALLETLHTQKKMSKNVELRFRNISLGNWSES